MACPRCTSVIVTKDGTTQLGGQRFRCSACGRRFTRRSSSAFSGRAFPDDIIALAVRWYVRYRLSYAEVSEWLAERGVLVDQSTVYRWVQCFLPLFGEAGRKHRDPIGPDWRADETYARIRGAGTTSIALSTDTATSWAPMCRRHATWFTRANSSSGQSFPVA
jgi:transposase-like protein